LRQRIVDLLEENQSMTVTDIYIKLRLELATDRHGKFIYYSLDKDRLAQISRLVEELAN